MGKQLDGQEVKEATLTAEDLAKLRSQGKLVWGGILFIFNEHTQHRRTG